MIFTVFEFREQNVYGFTWTARSIITEGRFAIDAIDAAKSRNATRHEVLAELARIPGMYVPSHFEIEYDGLHITRIEALEDSVYRNTIR